MFIELFGGIGGFRKGLEQANERERTRRNQVQSKNDTEWNSPNLGGREMSHTLSNPSFKCVWYNDNDKHSVKTYNKNFKENYEPTDIRTIRATDIPKHDILTAGFPCQSFSIAGKRLGFKDTRGTLFYEICRIAQRKRPRFLFLENVKGLLNHAEGRTFAIILASLSELGYDAEWEVLNSKHFGVPQNRERVFIIGHLRGQRSQQVFPLCQDAGEVQEISGGEKMNIVYTLERKDFRKHKSEGTPTLKQRMGTGGHNVPMIQDAGGFSKSQYGKGFRNDGTMFTLKAKTTPHGISYQNKLRRLTPVECERLQGFPDNWTRGVSDTQRYKQVGNAVTVNVIEAIGKKLLEVNY